MPDYSLGRAHGKIEIAYDGSGATKAARDLDAVTDSSADADKALTKTQKTLQANQKEAEGYAARLKEVEAADRNLEAAEKDLRAKLLDTEATLDDIEQATKAAADAKKTHAQATRAAAAAEKLFADESENTQAVVQETGKQFEGAGSAADGYRARLRDVESASRAVATAEQNHRSALLDTRATLDDIKDAENELAEARKRHAEAAEAASAAHRALTGEAGVSSRALSALSAMLPKLVTGLSGSNGQVRALTGGAGAAAGALDKAALAALALGQPQIAAAIKGVSVGLDTITSSARGVVGAVQGIAGFEAEFAKISGATLGLGSLGGLAGLGGAASVQGLVNVAGAVKQLSGGLGLLPAVVAGAAFSMQTLELAFLGVGDALTAMMDDDPTKFLESIKDMAPAAAQSLLQIAQFRNEFKMAAGAVQQSFFAQIADDIAPLIQTWLPAVTEGMSRVAAVFGQGASMLAQLLQQPAAMASFEAFVNNVSAGLQSLLPAIEPVVNIFSRLVVAGSSFFAQIGDSITKVVQSLSGIVDEASASGKLQDWIQTGINAFGHLVDIVGQFGTAFLNIMTIADQFGGGGLLGWLDDLTASLAKWTESPEGQEALTGFFSAVRQATDAFLPMLGPLLEGLTSIGKAFVDLGVATAPGWQAFFDMFAQSMANLAPAIVGTGPALNQFLHNMGVAMVNIVNQVGPRLPELFTMLSNAFSTLLPQIGPLVDIFLDLALNVGPQLPKFFAAVTALIEALLPYLPVLVDMVRNFVTVLTWFLESGAGVINWFTDFLRGVGEFAAKIPDAFSGVKDAITGFFAELPQRALEAGKNLIGGLVEGITSGLDSVGGAAKAVVTAIADFFQSSPAKLGPFSGQGYTLIRGQKMVTDMAAGMQAARPAIAAAAASTAAAASGALSAGAPAPGGRDTVSGALLPDHIAGASTSPLTAYLGHQFSDSRGLKGLAKEFGSLLEVARSGVDLISQNVMQPLFEGLGMLPGAKTQAWRKMDPDEFAAQQQQESERKSLQGNKKQDPTWQDVLGPNASADSGNGAPGAGSVPLIQNPDGTWTSPNAAWAALIKRESSGINQRQKIKDVNSGGNEAEGIFQITPQTWRANGGAEFAPNPLAASVQQQAAVAARILRANPSGSDWGAGLPGRENAQDLLAGLTGALPAGAQGPTWTEVTGTPAAAPTSAYPGDEALLANVPAGSYAQVQNADLAKGLADCSSAVEDLVNMMDGRPTGGRAMSTHNADQWLTEHGFQKGMGGLGDFRVGFNSGHMQATLPGGTPFNWGSDDSAARRGIGGTGADDPAFTSHYYRPVAAAGPAVATQVVDQNGNVLANIAPSSAATEVRDQNGDVLTTVPAGLTPGSGMTLPSGQSVDALLDSSAQSATANEQLLQAYLQGNPALAQQITAAQTPGASDETVMGTLTDISRTIETLQAQDAVGNKNAISALQSQQSTIAQQQGFTRTPNQLQQAQSIASAASGAIGGVFKAAQSGLEALAATQDIADRLVYGIRNTEDISKIVDNVQKYITFAADVLAAAGSIVSMAGQFTGGSDFGGTSAAGSALSLISSVLQGVNAAIDFGQQVYEITMGYVGRFMSFLAAGPGGSDLMGNVGFLLNKNTGQMLSYSMDNPQNQNAMNVPSFLNGLLGYGGGNPNPQVSQQLNIYAGPGQSPAEMMNETMWMVNTQGTSGALAPANF